MLLQCPHQGARNLTKAFFPDIFSFILASVVSSTAPLAIETGTIPRNRTTKKEDGFILR